MAIKKVEIRPKAEDGTYNDVLYPKTSADMVEGLFEMIEGIGLSSVNSHVTSQHTATKSHIDTKIATLPQKSVWTDIRAGKLDNLNQSITTTQTNINNHVTGQASAVLTELGKHVDGLHTTSNNHVTYTVNGARDNIKAHVTAEKNAIISAVNGKSIGVVKSVQRGIGLSPSAIDAEDIGDYRYSCFDVTISAVNINKSVVIVTQSPTAGQNFGGRLLNSTTLRIYCGGKQVYNWQVIEFY